MMRIKTLNVSILKLLFPALLFALITSCTSLEQGEILPRKEAVEEEIDNYIDEGRYATAVMKIEVLRRSSEVFTKSELNTYYNSTVLEIEKSFYTAIDEKDFLEAIKYYQILETIGYEESIEDWDLVKLKIARAELYREQGNAVAALNIVAEIEEKIDVDTALIREYAELALDHNHRPVLGKIAAIFKRKGIDIDPSVKKALAAEPDTENQISGTVTIWVDKGIKIEQGVGLPDRVIGSGFFIDKRGYLITNYHVISSEVDPEYEGFSRLYIRLPREPEKKIPAKVVGYDRIFDIALVKVELEAPYSFSLTDIRELKPGSRIFAIGSPVGLEKTITSGIISATGRRFLQLGDAMQVDVPVNPGSSGGPLLNVDGELVGVVFAGLEQFEGINFAIPSFWIRKFLPELYEKGEIEHPWIGTAVYEREEGLEVMYVYPGSPSDRRGLKTGDIVKTINGEEVNKIGKAQDILLSHYAGSLIDLEWVSEEKEVEGLISLEERPYIPLKEAAKDDLKYRLWKPLFGMEVERTGSTMFQEDYVINKVYPGMAADETGLSAGDPFTLREWRVIEEDNIALLQIFIRKRKAGFLESGVQMIAYLELDNFL